MKTYIGLFMLVMLLAAASGCTTQQAKPVATATTLTTTAEATEVTTTVTTHIPTKVSTTVAAPKAAANVTTVATPKPVKTPSTKITTIHIKNNAFVPDELTILPGTRITWINDDSGVHVVKATGDHKGMFTSSEMVSGASTGYDFSQLTGTFEFTDPSHPGMNGTIYVVEGDAVVGGDSLISSSS